MGFADYQIILERSAHAGKYVQISTKNRGNVIGKFSHVDEFEVDPNRLGYSISIDPHFCDVIFPEEIVEIREIQAGTILAIAV